MTRRRVRRAPAKVEEDEILEQEDELEEEDDDEEPEPEPEPQPRRRSTRKAKAPTTKDAVPEITPDDTVASATGNELADAIVAALDAGQTLMFRKVGPKYVIAKGADATIVEKVVEKTGKAMTRTEAEAIAMTDEYKEFQGWWPELSFEEKVKHAKKEKVTWEEHDSDLVNNMRLTMAYMDKVGISKWKPQYASSKARRALEYDGVELPDPEDEE